MKRIDVFMPPLSSYGVLHYFTQKIHEALVRAGIKARLLEAKKNDPAPFLKALFSDPPDCTLSFNGLLPDDQGRFFADMVQIPHVAYIVDSPNGYLPLTRSAYTITACVDKASVDFFKGMGFSKALFLPHATDRALAPDPEITRNFDVVMLSSCIDYEGIRTAWKRKYPPALRQAMEDAVEMALENPLIPYYQAFVQALDMQISRQVGIDPNDVDFVTVLEDIEMFLRGIDRVELVKSIKEAKVNIFGSADGLTGWKKYLGKKRNIKIHDPIPFEQALDVMRQSKIILNSCPWINYGGHERIFSGLACGALVLTNENNFLKEQFADGQSIVFYQYKRWDKANHRINEYLADENKREKVAAAGRQIVMDAHTWDHRAAQLIKFLPDLLKTLPPSRRK